METQDKQAETPKKESLLDKLKRMSGSEEVAEELNALSEDDMRILVSEIKSKVDSIHEVLSIFKSEAERLKGIAAKFSASQKACDNAHDRLLDFTKYAMESQGFDRLPGEIFSLQVVKRKAVKILRQPTYEDMFTLGEFIETSLKWKVTDLKSAFKTDETLSALCKEDESSYLKFTVRKEMKK